MSLAGEVTRLAEPVGGLGPGYLLTLSPQARVEVLRVDVRGEGALLVASGPSPGSGANLAANPAVTLVFAPAQPHGFSLIVDGVGRAVGDDFEVTPESAILHRPSAHADGPPPPVTRSDGPAGQSVT